MLEIKEYILFLTKESDYEIELHHLLHTSIELSQWKKQLESKEELLLELLKLFKQYIKTIEDGKELEEAIVYLTILLPYHQAVAYYKWQLFETLMKTKDKNIQFYCLVRHLIYKSQSRLAEVIELLATSQSCNHKEYHVLAIQIYCIENRHKEAYPHVKQVECNDIEEYADELFATHPFLYHKLCKHTTKQYALSLGGH